MEKRTIAYYVILILIAYITLSAFWINRLVNERLNSARSLKSSRTRTLAILEAAFDEKPTITTVTECTSNFVKLTDQKLGRLLQSESSQDNSTNKYERSTRNSQFNGSFKNGNSMKGRSSMKEMLVDLPHHSNTCLALVSGDDIRRQTTIRIIKEKQKDPEPKFRSDEVMARLFGKCKEIVEFLRAVSVDDVKNREVAFSILLNRPADQTMQFLRAIYDPSNLYCLHVDIHSSKTYFTLVKKISSCFSNIYLSPKRFNIAYPTVKRINAHNSCFKILLNTSVSWRYLISLTGSVFPLRNMTVLSHFLSDREYVNGIAARNSNNARFLRRVQFVHGFKRGPGNTKYFVRTRQRKQPPPGNVTLFRGEKCFFATRAFVEFVLESREAKELLLWAKDARNPDEFFWATMDSLPGAPGGTPYRKDEEISADRFTRDKEDIYTVQENDLVIRLWKGTNTHKCGGKFYGNVCMFSYADLRWLLTQDNLFAESFDMSVDRIVLECLQQNLRRPLIEDYS